MMISLQQGEEWKEVEQKFKATMPQAQIEKIERV
jgi:hypothetical protein